MTNKEKNKERFDELEIGDSSNFTIAQRIAVRKSGYLDLCELTPCHDCIFRRGHCFEDAKKWLKDEAEPDKRAPEEKEKMEKDEIKVGDTVKTTRSRMRESKIGIVSMIHRAKNGKKFYYVRCDGESCGHVFFEHEIEKVKSKKTPPRIVIYQNGDTVTARDLKTGEEANAVCSKDDTFDFHTGAFIAMARLTHFMDNINVMRKEMEHADSYIDDIKMRFGYLMGE